MNGVVYRDGFAMIAVVALHRHQIQFNFIYISVESEFSELSFVPIVM